MDLSAVRSVILRVLYETYFRDDSPVDIDEIRKQLNINATILEEVTNKLESENLIRVRTAGPSYSITAQGILVAEEKGIAPRELITQNEHIRSTILDELVRIYDENRWYSDSHFEMLAKATGFDVYAVVFNLKCLHDLGYVKPVTYASYAPTEYGDEIVRDRRRRKELLSELARIETSIPQQRGRDFEKLFAKIMELSGWLCEEGVSTSHEEIDIFCHKNREYYLIECKWEKDAIEASVVRELFGKLGNRSEIRGILVSMSGFTAGAAEQVKDYANANLVFLFGHDDVNDLLLGKSLFDNLLDEKHHQLVTRRKVVYR